MRLTLLLAVLVALAVPASAQHPALAQVAAQASDAVRRHAADQLVAGSDRVRVLVPGSEPSAAVGRAQASAMLAAWLAPAQELGAEVRAARELTEERGYVELDRRYQVAGSRVERRQTVFLAYQRVDGRWVLTELRAVD